MPHLRSPSKVKPAWQELGGRYALRIQATPRSALAREHVSKGRVIRLHMPAINQRHFDAMSKLLFAVHAVM